ncbi:MAG: hypothetical protein HKN85_00750 [Gammaproteobacteria bacterium]|nr:hypothetical protein [Gammaproteobacteria bacterium]
MKYSLTRKNPGINAMGRTVVSLMLFFLVFGHVDARKADEPGRIYKLLGKAPKGTKFKPVDARSPIPFNKSYQQLTDSQRAIYRSYFEGIKDSETPPFPEGGTQVIYKPLIKGHARIGGGGFLALRATVDEKGIVDKVAVYLTPSKKMTDLAIAVLFNTRFEPATCDGEPCEMEYPFEFELRKQFKSIVSLDKENFGNSDRR